MLSFKCWLEKVQVRERTEQIYYVYCEAFGVRFFREFCSVLQYIEYHRNAYNRKVSLVFSKNGCR